MSFMISKYKKVNLMLKVDIYYWRWSNPPLYLLARALLAKFNSTINGYPSQYIEIIMFILNICSFIWSTLERVYTYSVFGKNVFMITFFFLNYK